MKNIVYYVAASVDGFITGMNEDVSQFSYEGNAISKYLDDLKSYETVIMGRNTYEFGYKFGVQPGEPSPIYSHMKHYIFSDNLSFEHADNQVEIKKLDLVEIDKIKSNSKTDIYLCGGGQLAGWLLENKKIDILKIKLNPVILNQGIKLFENVKSTYSLHILENKFYEDGVQLLTYKVNY